jgi:GNAT superfamily N-acetyltransferase
VKSGSSRDRVTVVRHETAAAFLEHAQPWLMRAEVENNVILGIALDIARNALVPLDRPYFATAVAHGDVVACAIRTPPHKLLVSRAIAGAAIPLARDAYALYPRLAALSGPEPTAGAMASAWATLAGIPARPGRQQRIHVIRSLAPGPPTVSGTLRRAGEADLVQVVEWIAAFVEEAAPDEPSDPLDITYRYFSQEGLFVWDDGGPVALAAFSGRTANGIRVGPVYTPPERRRRGYATAAVSALTGQLLDAGHRYCCLYTDLANATSNRIYRQIGYQPVCDVNDYVLAG